MAPVGCLSSAGHWCDELRMLADNYNNQWSNATYFGPSPPGQFHIAVLPLSFVFIILFRLGAASAEIPQQEAWLLLTICTDTTRVSMADVKLSVDPFSAAGKTPPVPVFPLPSRPRHRLCVAFHCLRG